VIKKYLKRTINNISSHQAGNECPRIIYYHSVNNNNSRSHSVLKFKEQMKWLYDNGYKAYTISEISQHSHNNKTVYITFDDGYYDNVSNALSILVKYGFKATFFIATKYTSCSSQRVKADEGFRLYNGLYMMNLKDLEILKNAGMEIGSHGVSHSMISRLDLEKQTYELSESKRFLEENLNINILSFAYPNGQKGAISKYANEQALFMGYKQICTTLWGPLKENNGYIFPRCEMSQLDSLSDFIDKVQGKRDYRYYLDRYIDKSKAWD
jgi:peptidoglycan/xylan/chitin deacetylase (PgdA/CDA1 family)